MAGFEKVQLVGSDGTTILGPGGTIDFRVKMYALDSGGNSVPVNVSDIVGVTGGGTSGNALEIQGSNDVGALPIVTSIPLVRVATEITRAASPASYVLGSQAGALITLPGVGRVNAGTGYVTFLRLATNLNLAGVFRVYLWNVSPTVPADGSQFALLYADDSPAGKLIGYSDLTIAGDGTGSDSAYGFDPYIRWPFVCAAGQTSLFATIVSRGAYASVASQKFSVGIAVEQN